MVVTPRTHLKNLQLEQDQREYANKLQNLLGELVQNCVQQRATKEPADVLFEQLEERLMKRKEIPFVFSSSSDYLRAFLAGKTKDDLDLFQILGKGTVGVVHLAKVKEDRRRKPFALKVMKKTRIITLDVVEAIRREQKLQAKVNHPFIVNFLSSYQDEKCIYVMLEYVNGGELFSLIRERKRLDLDTSRLYSAEMVLVFEYLHHKDIVYRDLKTENVLISAQGHLKLADFGFSKMLRPGEKTYTACGTPAYMAPEIIKKTCGYDRGVDWWALGVLTFEMVVGREPFGTSGDANTTYGNILMNKCQYPGGMNKDVQDYCRRLMHPKCAMRNGCKTNGAKDVKDHAFFKSSGFDFDACLAAQTPGPYATQLAEDDTSKYDAIEVEEETEEQGLTEEQQKLFEGPGPMSPPASPRG